jgi:hypothetical protein
MTVLELPNNVSKGPKVPYLTQSLKEAIRLAKEAEWQGDTYAATYYWRVVDRLKERLGMGEQFDPQF